MTAKAGGAVGAATAVDLTDDRYAGRRVVVTGAAGGFGRVVTATFASRGARVLALDRADAVTAFADGLSRREGAEVTGVVCDLTDAVACDRILPALLGGPISVLVNALGVFGGGRVVDQPRAEWEAVIAANLYAAVAATAACLPGLLRADWGRVVNLASGIAVRGRAGASAYAASKAGLMAFTRSLAEELRGTSVTANCIGPGATDTPLFRATFPAVAAEGAPDEGRPLGRPDDLIPPLLFLCGRGASGISGTTLWMKNP